MSGRSPLLPPAFSILELLICLSMLSVLLGLLLPSLAGARNAARSAACASNIRQLQLANDLHAADHADRYVPGAPDILTNLARWHGVRTSAAAPFAPEGAPLTEYLGAAATSAALRACPDFAPTLDSLQSRAAGFESSCGGYGYNNAFVGVERARAAVTGAWEIPTDPQGKPRDTLGARRHLFTSPARTIAFADAALAHDRSPERVIEYSFLEPRFWPDWPTARPDPSIHFRHGASRSSSGAATVAWLDGHVSTEHLTETWTSNYYTANPRAAAVGWFGDADDNSLFDYD